tara:strand:+ start:99 stop:293 length:195 start_codon:yes stop_codon:yes gene_type:complete
MSFPSDFTVKEAKAAIGKLKGDTICCFCAQPVKEFESHNAWPVMDDRCCETCNYVVVVPARLKS